MFANANVFYPIRRALVMAEDQDLFTLNDDNHLFSALGGHPPRVGAGLRAVQDSLELAQGQANV